MRWVVPAEPFSAAGCGHGTFRTGGGSARIPFRLVLWTVLVLLVLLAAPPGRAEDVLSVPEPARPPAAPAEASVDPEVDPRKDDAIAERLRAAYAAVDGLAPVDVRVSAGVVVLTGEVSSQALRQQAARLARTIRGVAEVENRVEVAQDLEGRLAPALKRLAEVWRDLVRLSPVLLVGLAIMAVAVVIARWLARRHALYRGLSDNAFIASLVAQLVQAVVVLIGVALTLLLLDATGLVNTLLGAAGILGLALGFALRDTVENYIASILLSVRQPFEPYDLVRIEEQEGLVVRLTSRATILLTLDGNQVRIPNATVFKGLIINFTRQPDRRFTFQLGIAPDEDLGRAQRTATEALATVEGVLAEPAPTALYESVGDSAVILTVAGWMNQSSHDFIRVRSEAIRVVLTQMDMAGIDLPEPTLRLRRAPPPARSGGESAPAIATGRDQSLDRVVARERTRRGDLLEADGDEE